jgi:hypothetical protein
MAERFIAQWKATHEEFPEAATVARWYAEHRVTLLYQDAVAISLVSAEEAYSGGAHANSSTRYASFALTDGDRLSLDELFVPGYRPRLNEIAARGFRAARGIPADRSLEDAGFWFDDGFAVNDNFAVVEAGLMFYYDPYEIGPYSLGPTRLTITLEELRELIAPGSPLSR